MLPHSLLKNSQIESLTFISISVSLWNEIKCCLLGMEWKNLQRICPIMRCGDHAVWKHDHPPPPLSLSVTHVAYPVVTDLMLRPVNHWSQLFSHVWSFPLSAFIHTHTVHTLSVLSTLKHLSISCHTHTHLGIFFLPFVFTHSWCWHCFLTHANTHTRDGQTE